MTLDKIRGISSQLGDFSGVSGGSWGLMSEGRDYYNEYSGYSIFKSLGTMTGETGCVSSLSPYTDSPAFSIYGLTRPKYEDKPDVSSHSVIMTAFESSRAYLCDGSYFTAGSTVCNSLTSMKWGLAQMKAPTCLISILLKSFLFGSNFIHHYSESLPEAITTDRSVETTNKWIKSHNVYILISLLQSDDSQSSKTGIMCRIESKMPWIAECNSNKVFIQVNNSPLTTKLLMGVAGSAYTDKSGYMFWNPLKNLRIDPVKVSGVVYNYISDAGFIYNNPMVAVSGGEKRNKILFDYGMQSDFGWSELDKFISYYIKKDMAPFNKVTSFCATNTECDPGKSPVHIVEIKGGKFLIHVAVFNNKYWNEFTSVFPTYGSYWTGDLVRTLEKELEDWFSVVPGFVKECSLCSTKECLIKAVNIMFSPEVKRARDGTPNSYDRGDHYWAGNLPSSSSSNRIT